MVTMRRKAVARILPAVLEKTKPPQWPDFESRQKAVFGDKVFPNDLMKYERESYPW